ncbi:MAG: tripeptide aminopeptidase, partial [Candidatus Promineifilaceae bacterium]
MIESAIHDLLALLPIPGPPAKEKLIAEHLHGMLVDMGIPGEDICYDRAQEQSEYGGEVGNMIVKIAGQQSGSTLMFSTHMDTVPQCVGCKPRLDREQNRIVNDAPNTALG